MSASASSGGAGDRTIVLNYYYGDGFEEEDIVWVASQTWGDLVQRGVIDRNGFRVWMHILKIYFGQYFYITDESSLGHIWPTSPRVWTAGRNDILDPKSVVFMTRISGMRQQLGMTERDDVIQKRLLQDPLMQAFQYREGEDVFDFGSREIEVTQQLEKKYGLPLSSPEYDSEGEELGDYLDSDDNPIPGRYVPTHFTVNWVSRVDIRHYTKPGQFVMLSVEI